MKSTSRSANKTNDPGPMQQARELGEPNSLSGKDSIPRERWIAEAAYFRAERRGFIPGNETSDWLEAETDIERMLESGRITSDLT